MLSSPGRSPGHLSSPSPYLSAKSEQNSSDSSSNPPKKKPTVLDEDTYVAAIEKIIERDFFPDIPKLRDCLDCLEAVRSGDPVQILDAQLKIMGRRAGKNAAAAAAQGSIRTTPGSTSLRMTTPFVESGTTPTGLERNGLLGSFDSEEENQDSVDVSLNLDEFLRRYTSEDNESFSKIMEKVNRKRKERHGYLTEGEEEKVGMIGDANTDRITNGYGTSDQPVSTLEGWNYTAKKLLMYNPSDRGEAPLTEEERAERLNERN